VTVKPFIYLMPSPIRLSHTIRGISSTFLPSWELHLRFERRTWVVLSLSLLLFACGTAVSDNPPDGSAVSHNPPAPDGAINVKSAPYNAKGDGVTVDTEAIKAALAVSRLLIFPEGTYNLGDVGSTTPKYGILFVVDGGGGAIHFQTVGKVKFVVNTIDPSVPTIFRFLNASSVYFGPHVEFEDTGYDPAINWQGAAAINLYADVGSGPLTNVTLPSIKATTLVQAVVTNGGTTESTRVSDVKIGILDCDDCYYGFNAQNNGDDVTIGLLKTNRAIRSYFVYGVTGHRVNIDSVNPRSADADCNVTAYGDVAPHEGLNTSDIKIKYAARDLSEDTVHVGIHTIGSSRVASVSGVDVEVDITGSISSVLADWRDYPFAGALSQNTGATDNYIDRIRLSGRIDSLAPIYFDVQSQPTTSGTIQFEGDFISSKITNAVRTYMIVTQN
jgi:hypothetical protein